jgi:hypothetical protein
MVGFTLESGMMTYVVDEGLRFIRMGISTAESSPMEWLMGLDFTYGIMASIIMGNGSKALRTASVFGQGLMGSTIRANGRHRKQMAMVCMYEPMVTNTRVNGRLRLSMETGRSSIERQVIYMKVSSTMERSTDMGRTHMPQALSIVATSKTG